MRRTQIQLDEATYAAARRRAFETRVSLAAVIRDAVATSLGVRAAPPAHNTFRFVASGKSGQKAGARVSEHHDAAFADAAAGRSRR